MISVTDKMKSLFVFLSCSILLWACSWGKALPTKFAAGNITGRVIDSINNTAIQSAQIGTEPPTNSVMTDVQGRYFINNVPSGYYTVTVEKSGYASENTKVLVVVDKTTTADLLLTETTAPFIRGSAIHSAPIAYYPFRKNAADESGNGMNGSVFGATAIEDRLGHLNSAFELDGVDDYILIESDISGHVEFTQSLWVWIAKKQTLSSDISKQRHIIQTGDGGIYYWPEDESFLIDFYVDRQGGKTTKTATRYYYRFGLDDIQSEWAHITYIVYADNTAQFFVNGSKIAIGARITDIGVTGDYDATVLGATIDSSRGWVGDYMPMRIDDVRIFDYSLDETEILSLYYDQGS
jgi:hypothetical protein